jgi:cyclic pyranopterin phosphate synthase
MEGEEKFDVPSPEMMVDEIVRIVRIGVGLGISRVKLTGGEPLLRDDIVEIVKGIGSTPGLTDLSMTTNGTRLAALAEELHKNGLQRLNITLPTINEQLYRELTGGSLRPVLKGIKTAVVVGFHPVKLNMVVLKDVNDGSFWEMLEFAKKARAILQLIELEPVNVSDDYYSRRHKSLDEYESALSRMALTVETRRLMQSRRVYHLPDVTVEVIHPIENAEFCMHCTRLRLTSDGKLKPCLMLKGNLVDVLTPLRNGADDEELMALFEVTNQKRQPYVKEKKQAQVALTDQLCSTNS